MIRLSTLFKNCFYDVKYEQVGEDVNYTFVREGTTLYIYFEGSNSFMDWVKNFTFPARPYKDMEIPYKVHRGFLSAWKQVEDIVIAKITELSFNTGKYKYSRIVTVGYSHGAALAGLCHECVWFHRPDLRNGGIDGIAFEAPRFFAGFKVPDNLKERWQNFYVFRNNNDIVTHCPPALFGFTHVGEIIQIHGDPAVSTRKLPKCVKSHLYNMVYDGLLKYEADVEKR